jgi:uncharacterized protein (DUF2235 family)
MGKNIVILSDGTGQRGGVSFDEVRTNIYKLFRATRGAPDCSVDARQQVAFYDPGVGTMPPGLGFVAGAWAFLRNLVCQATGLGLTKNIVDCYAAIIQYYEPGDRIFLFGFSRGAYTARCVGGVLALCGVPTRQADGSPQPRDQASALEIAGEAVRRVYKFADESSGPRLRDVRTKLADRFRERHGCDSGDANAPSNAYPHFIGVFDTVAALGSYDSFLVLFLVGALGTFAAWMVFAWFSFAHAGAWTAGLVGLALVVGVAASFVSRAQAAFGLPNTPWWKTFHFNRYRVRFANTELNENVGYARHALAIDERRGDFDKVMWGNRGEAPKRAPGGPDWLQQVWFAGCHADIGGGYSEAESRLSDIPFAWMIDAATSIPSPLLVDRSVLQLSPDAAGVQHDETLSWEYRIAKKINRHVLPEAPVHPTVEARFDAPAAMQCGLMLPYRPESLRHHEKFAARY